MTKVRGSFFWSIVFILFPLLLSALPESVDPEVTLDEILSRFREPHVSALPLERLEMLRRMTPLQRKFLEVYEASGIDTRPLSGSEIGFRDILETAYPYFGEALANYWERYLLLLLPGLCHWSYRHFYNLDRWLQTHQEAATHVKILYALPEGKWTDNLPLVELRDPRELVPPQRGDSSLMLLSTPDGPLRLDEVVAHGGRWLSHLTWSSVNTVVGGLITVGYAVGSLFLDGEFEMSFDNGTFIVDSPVHYRRWCNYSCGPFYFGSFHYDAHEAGHTYQAALLGPFYLPLSGISFVSLGNTDNLLNWSAGSVSEWAGFDRRIRNKPGHDEIINALFEIGADVEALQYCLRLSLAEQKKLFYVDLLPIAGERKEAVIRVLDPYRSQLGFYILPLLSDQQRADAVHTYIALQQALETGNSQDPFTYFWDRFERANLSLDLKLTLIRRAIRRSKSGEGTFEQGAQLRENIGKFIQSLWERNLLAARDYHDLMSRLAPLQPEPNQ